MKKLLTSASIAALLSTGAMAQTLAPAPTDGTGTNPIDAYYVIAEEADIAGADLNATIEFELSLANGANFPADENIVFSVNISGATFTAPITSASVNTGAGSIDSAIVNQGGGAGGTTVEYIVSTNDTTLGGTIGFDIPVTYAGCPSNITVSVSALRLESQQQLQSGMASMPYPFVQCTDAVSASVTSDEMTVDTQLNFQAATPLSEFVVNAPDTTTNGFLADLELEIAQTFDYDGMGSLANVNVDLAGNQIALSDVTGFTGVLTFPEGVDGIASAQANPTSGAFWDAGPEATVTTTNTVTLTSAIDADAATSEGTLQVTLNGMAVEPQTVGADFTLLTTAALGGAMDMLAITGETTDRLDPNSANFGPYDWVGQAGLASRNIFRVTGIDDLTGITVQAVVTNSSAGDSFNRTYTLTGLSVTNGNEILITQNTLSDVIGDFGRADIEFRFFTSGAGVDVDRLLATGDGVVSTFGNTQNGDD